MKKKLFLDDWRIPRDCATLWFVDYQNHDFSMRGMGGKSSIVNSGLGFAIPESPIILILLYLFNI